jgi:hypothetical protein
LSQALEGPPPSDIQNTHFDNGLDS